MQPEYNQLYTFGDVKNPGLFKLLNRENYLWYCDVTEFKWLNAKVSDPEKPIWNSTRKKTKQQVNIEI